MKSGMRDLQAVSYEIKQKYPTSRRNVLMDDDTLELVLDFCVVDGGSWRKMSVKQAKERRAKRNASAEKFRLDEGEIDGLLDCSAAE